MPVARWEKGKKLKGRRKKERKDGKMDDGRMDDWVDGMKDRRNNIENKKGRR